jgi:hypothetical protein
MDTDTDHDNHRDNYKNLPMQGFYLRFFDIKSRVNYSKNLAKLVRIYTAEKKSKNFPIFLLKNDNFCQKNRNCAHGREILKVTKKFPARTL